jgi:ketosteroid isomerase-like protein
MPETRSDVRSVSHGVPDWVAALFASIDAQDVPRFLSHLAADACFKFGNLPAAVGHAAIDAAVRGFYASIAGLRHELLNVWTADTHVIVQGAVHYTRLDGRGVTLPFANVFELDGELIRGYLVYIDPTPLYAPA